MDTIWLPNLQNCTGPKYRALELAIRQAIRGGQLKQGDKLPPVRDLGWRTGVTPGTVARAYKNLVDAGVLDATVGRGTFVPIQHVEKNDSMQETGVTLLSPRLPDEGQAELIREAMHRYASSVPTDRLLRYPTRECHAPAHTAFVEANRTAPIGPFTESDVVITHGGQHAIVLIMQTVFKGLQPAVIVDELSYAGFRRAAELCRAQVHSVSWDDEGPVIEEFEALVRDNNIQMYCASSDVCNPTARMTSVPRRHQIAEIARRYGVHIIDDDCYRNGPFLGPSYRQLLPELGWYTTSPSKSISAALRIGFVVAPQGWANALVRAMTFNSFGVPESITATYAMIQQHPLLPEILERCREKMDRLLRAAVNYLGGYQLRWQKDVPFIWLELPYGWRSGEFCHAVEAQSVFLKSSEEFGLRKSKTVHAVRIAINGSIPESRFEEAMVKLRTLLDNPPEQITV